MSLGNLRLQPNDFRKRAPGLLQIARTGAVAYDQANPSSGYVPPYAQDKLSYDYLKFTG